MLGIRHAKDSGRTDWGWLDSRHTFSFADYHDPNHMGFRSLRVINDDRVKPGAGFGSHSHRDMEIFSYVLEGSLAHKDSTGTGSVIRPGEIQMMRAGTGITHSEYSSSKTDPVHFLQIWILPDSQGLTPSYDQQPVNQDAARNSFALLAARDGRNGSLRIQQDAEMLCAFILRGENRTLEVRPSRHVWIHIATGSVAVDGVELEAGDGVSVSEKDKIHFIGKSTSQVLVFDLA